MLKRTLEHRNAQLLVLFVALFVLKTTAYKIALIVLVWLSRGGLQYCYRVSKTFRRDLSYFYRLIRVFGDIIGIFFYKLNFVKLFRIQVERKPDSVMFVNANNDEEWTFARMDEYSNKIANHFLSQGYKKGDAVALFMGNRPEYVGIWLGLGKIGVITALINTNLKEDSLFHTIKIAESKALIYGSELQKEVESVRNTIREWKSDFSYYQSSKGLDADSSSPIDSDLDSIVQKESSSPSKIDSIPLSANDQLFYIYTSGTTGLPKAVLITHLRQLLVSYGSARMIPTRPDDVLYTYLPLYHSAGSQVGVHGSFVNGIKTIIKKKFSASQFWSDCVKYDVTGSQYIGEICRFLIKSKHHPDETRHKVRILFGNGLRSEIWQEFIARFRIPNITEFYGATEGNCTMTNFDNTVGAVGCFPLLLPLWLTRKFLPVYIIKVNPETMEVIRDENGRCIECDIDEPGEAIGRIVRGNPITKFQGYRSAEDNRKKILRDVFAPEDEFFRSGDILVKDELGYIYFKDRSGDTFRWKGENVSTFEVETVINGTLNVTNVGVYGVNVPGTDGKAGMVVIPGGQEDESEILEKLYRDLERKLPPFAIPCFVRFMPSDIALTGTFKVQKFNLKAEGFDLNKVKEGNLFVIDRSLREYRPLTKELHTDICNGKFRL